MKRETIETILWIFCIIVVLAITYKIYYEAEDYDCDKCEVILFNQIAGGGMFEFGTFKISELYDEYKNGTCAITWSPTQGYTRNG